MMNALRGCAGDVGALLHLSLSHFAAAALSINLATGLGFDTIAACDAPLITTVCLECARSAMNAKACGGMFLSLSP